MMNAKRATIGRTFDHSSFLTSNAGDNFSQIFILASGKRAEFTFQKIPAQEVTDKTFVTVENNGRDQDALTHESLKDITRTIRLQQFFPAIGRRIGERIEILDGSRRRAAAILCQTGLSVLVTDTEISGEDARRLAKDIQTAKEYNLREVGLRLLMLKDSGMSQKDIAQAEALSQTKVTRALQAASVPSELLALFPVQSELSYPDYKRLFTLHEQIIEKGYSLGELIRKVSAAVEHLTTQKELAHDEVKDKILKYLSNGVADMRRPAVKEKVISRSLWNFADKDRFARKKSKGRTFSYEFNRLPKDLQDELDRAVEEILSRHLIHP